MNYRDPFVIPLKDGTKAPAETDWQLNSARMTEAPRRWPGVARWGMPTGPINGVWILDVDIKSNGPGTLGELERRHGVLPTTREVRTQSGGRHLYFRWDPERPVGCWVGRLPGLDTRGPGGQAVIPPTQGYTWTFDVEPADAPDWLYEELRAAAPNPGRDESNGDRPPGLPVDHDAALRDVRSFPPAGEGGRGAAVWKLAVRLVRGHGLQPDEAARLIEEHYNPRCAPPWAGDELQAIDRACRRAETAAKVPWGFTFYQGRLNDVMLRAIRRYGVAGSESSSVPYRVWPDGRMRRLDQREGLARAIKDVVHEIGAAQPSTEQAWRYVSWWKIEQRIAGEHPTSLVLNDEPGPSLARLVIAPGPTPSWDEFLERLDSPDTFLAWVWMLALPKASRQVLWMLGDGHDGKTEVGKAIVRALGLAASTLDDGYMDASGRWVGSQLYGKRFVFMDDTKLRQVLRRGVVHRITGRSLFKCEFKGVDAFDFEPNAAVMVASNKPPMIGRGRADRTRLLQVTVKNGRDTADTEWTAKLVKEFPALMHRAREAYDRLAAAPGAPQLRVADAAVADSLNAASAADDEANLMLLESVGLLLEPDGEVKGREFMDRMGAKIKLNTNEWHDFVEWLAERGVSQRRTATGRFWVGVKSA